MRKELLPGGKCGEAQDDCLLAVGGQQIAETIGPAQRQVGGVEELSLLEARR